MPNLKGIVIQLDDGSTIDVDINKVHALAWGSQKIHERDAKQLPYSSHKIHCTHSLSEQEVRGVCQWIYPPGYWEC